MQAEIPDGVIDVGGGVTLTPATDADFAKLNADLREGDRTECRALGAEGDDLKWYERAWVYAYRGDMLGIAGWTNFLDADASVPYRLVIMVSMNSVDRHKFVYVKYSKAVFRKLAEFLPEWVTDLYALPMTSYAKSIRWQERVLKMVPEKQIAICGVPHTVMHVAKSEVMKW